MPQMMLIRVVLPAPFGPRSARISPRRMVRSMRLSACRPLAYVLLTPATVTIGDDTAGSSTMMLAAAFMESFLRQSSRGRVAAEVVLVLVVTIPLLGLGVGRRMLGQVFELCQHLFDARRIQVQIHESPAVGGLRGSQIRRRLIRGDCF